MISCKKEQKQCHVSWRKLSVEDWTPDECFLKAWKEFSRIFYSYLLLFLNNFKWPGTENFTFTSYCANRKPNFTLFSQWIKLDSNRNPTWPDPASPKIDFWPQTSLYPVKIFILPYTFENHNSNVTKSNGFSITPRPGIYS